MHCRLQYAQLPEHVVSGRPREYLPIRSLHPGCLSIQVVECMVRSHCEILSDGRGPMNNPLRGQSARLPQATSLRSAAHVLEIRLDHQATRD